MSASYDFPTSIYHDSLAGIGSALKWYPLGSVTHRPPPRPWEKVSKGWRDDDGSSNDRIPDRAWQSSTALWIVRKKPMLW